MLFQSHVEMGLGTWKRGKSVHPTLILNGDGHPESGDWCPDRIGLTVPWRTRLSSDAESIWGLTWGTKMVWGTDKMRPDMVMRKGVMDRWKISDHLTILITLVLFYAPIKRARIGIGLTGPDINLEDPSQSPELDVIRDNRIAWGLTQAPSRIDGRGIRDWRIDLGPDRRIGIAFLRLFCDWESFFRLKKDFIFIL